MISLVIPAFNEEDRLAPSLEKLKTFLKDFDHEIEVLVVDDGSTDKTIEVADGFKETLPLTIIPLRVNRGKGFAVNQGFRSSSGEFVIFTDADFSTPITEINKLLEELENGFDVVVGSRALDRSTVKRHQNIFREFMGRTFNVLVKIIAVKGIADTQCGFKGFKRHPCQEIFEKQTIWDFGFDVELLFLAQKKKLKIKEVSVLWFNDPRSSVNPFRDSLRTFFDLIKIRLLHYKGL